MSINTGLKYIIVDNDETDEDDKEIVYTVTEIDGEWAMIEYTQYSTGMDDSIRVASLEKKLNSGEYKLV